MRRDKREDEDARNGRDHHVVMGSIVEVLEEEFTTYKIRKMLSPCERSVGESIEVSIRFRLRGGNKARFIAQVCNLEGQGWCKEVRGQAEQHQNRACEKLQCHQPACSKQEADT